MRIHEEVEVRFPHGFLALPSEQSLTDDAVRYSSHVHGAGNVATLVFDLETLRDAVMPPDVPTHLALVDSIRQSIELSIPEKEEEAAPSRLSAAGQSDWVIGVGGLVGAALVVVFVRFVTRPARQVKFQREVKSVLAAGETAATAIHLADRAAVEKAFTGERCSCGAVWSALLPDEAWSKVRYGEEAITVIRARCPSCGSPRTRYFRLGEA
jgi:hypothetical protein